VTTLQDARRVLIFITGRGLGGDAKIAFNTYKALTERGIHCEIALDKNAPGYLFKKNNIPWHKVSIPQAGGHAATKLTTIKAAFKTLHAGFIAARCIRKAKADVAVGVIGGGAVIAALGAKLSRTPSVSLVSTPLDTKVCSKISDPIILPESPLFRDEAVSSHVKAFLPTNSHIVEGDRQKALQKIEEHCENNPQYRKFDPEKQTIMFSSGSTLFEKTAKAVELFASKHSDEFNIVVIGSLLDEEYEKYLDDEKVIYVGYIDWVADLYALSDLAVLTDDGLMLQEAMLCNIPIVILKRVKYNRYHNMEAIFKGATKECDLEDLDDAVFEILNNLESYSGKTDIYKEAIANSSSQICDIVESHFKD
jgi:UDP-N-acetylglucosamine--N-acetylmuramyl-(pentapeptide) pyrophosphoryl-undecaprenol N-acetylglucosamine transferase